MVDDLKILEPDLEVQAGAAELIKDAHARWACSRGPKRAHHP